MTTANPSQITPPPPLTAANAGDTRPDALVSVYFRQSSDGVNFTVTPTLLHPADAGPACRLFPWEWATGEGGFASWPPGYRNAAQSVGGRGRLAGASHAAG